jgi:hypothetical protein
MANPLTPAQAQRLLTRMYGNRAARLSPLGAGEWSQAYAFDLDGQPAVIRFGNYVADFSKDQAMAQCRLAYFDHAATWGFTGLASLMTGGALWRVPWSPGFLIR